MKKYELTEQYLYDERNNQVFQIKALKNFGDVKKGDLGGYIQREYNLSQEGDCWVYGNSSVSEFARVQDDAKIKDFCKMNDYARLRNNSLMLEEAHMEGMTDLADNAIIKGEAHMEGRARAFGDAIIEKSPIYIYDKEVRITITDDHIIIDGVSNVNQYTKQEWLDLQSKSEIIDKKYGIEWRKWKPILKSML